MSQKSGWFRWRVAGVILVLASAASAIVLWNRAAPPSPDAVLTGLRLQHGIELDRDRREVEWDFDRIATEWAGLVLARSSLSPSDTPWSIESGGWRCCLRLSTDVEAGSVILGSGTVASGHGSTLTRRTPDGRLECDVKYTPGEGPCTFLLIAVPTGTVERFRFRVF